MDIKRNDPSKVIVVPRPPRSANPDLVPIDTPVDADPVEADPLADPLEGPNRPIQAVDPGCGPLNNEVEGPAETLAGEEEEA